MIQRQTNQNKNFIKRSNIVLIVVVIVGVLLLSYTPTRGVITSSVFPFATSIWSFKKSVSTYIGSFSVIFEEKEALYAENILLHEEVNRMQTLVLDRNLLKEKNDGLLEVLGRTGGDNRIVANVLSGAKQSFYDTLIVDAGEEAGVAPGNVVVYSGAGVIGEVIEITRTTSKVGLYSAPGKEHSVVIGRDSVPALARAKGMGNFEALVPKGSKIALGDNVTSVDGKLIFGTVSLVEEEEAQPTEHVFFRLPFNITKIRTVEIIR